jgi:hypothetical protein
MDHNFRVRFGEVECELGVAQTPESGFVAWALRIEPDGRLTPLQDRQGRLLLERGSTESEALAAVRAHGAAAFGAEQPSAAAALAPAD